MLPFIKSQYNTLLHEIWKCLDFILFTHLPKHERIHSLPSDNSKEPSYSSLFSFSTHKPKKLAWEGSVKRLLLVALETNNVVFLEDAWIAKDSVKPQFFIPLTSRGVVSFLEGRVCSIMLTFRYSKLMEEWRALISTHKYLQTPRSSE